MNIGLLTTSIIRVKVGSGRIDRAVHRMQTLCVQPSLTSIADIVVCTSILKSGVNNGHHVIRGALGVWEMA
jgi:hypothetical protein